MRSASPEDVTDLIQKPADPYVPEPRYVSRFRDKVRRAAKRGKSAHKTLGVPNVSLNPPTQYLKKNSNEQLNKKPNVHHKHYHRPGYQHKLPEWQPIKASEIEANKTSQSRVDFTKRNIDVAKNLRPSRPRKYYVDDRHGNSHPLESSGLFPTYKMRKMTHDYNQLPGNISLTINRSEPKRHDKKSPRPEHKMKDKKKDPGGRKNDYRDRGNEDKKYKSEVKRQGGEEVKHSKASEKHHREDKRRGEMKEQQEDPSRQTKSLKDRGVEDQINNTHEESQKCLSSTASTRSKSREQQPRCRYVTEDERAELLYGMKRKWDEMMKTFQRLPFLTDTPPKAKRKSKLEKDLLQLEKDIEIIQRHPYIYIYSDDEE